MICGKEDFYGLLRRLYCGHCIDDVCLKKLFEIKEIWCPFDDICILKGFASAF